MKEPPVILVQFVHIQGPLKGQIQEFSEPAIAIGRHPSCQVQFPAELTAISRRHADLIREGNRFKLVDCSTNGTFVNGKRITEAFLKDGDVIMFTEGGPKVSFLAQIKTESTAERPAAEPVAPAPVPTPPSAPAPAVPAPEPAIPARPAAPVQEAKPQPEIQSVARVQAPLFIQFGPTLKSYKELPVVIGQQADCDFVLAHPSVSGRHAQIFFSQNRYWVRDLTGRSSITVNGSAIGLEASLKSEDVIRLAPGGPALRFLGEGRLAEHEEAPEQTPPADTDRKPAEDKPRKKKSIFDVFKK